MTIAKQIAEMATALLLCAGLLRAQGGSTPPVGTLLPANAFQSLGTTGEVPVRFVDFTTPAVRRILDELVAEVDTPIGGRRAFTRPWFVGGVGDEVLGFVTSRGDLVLGRDLIQELSGVRLVRRDPTSLDRAFQAILADPRKADFLKGIIAHEAGHAQAGHIGLPSLRGMGPAAAIEMMSLESRMDFHRLQAAVESETRESVAAHRARMQQKLEHPTARAVFDTDRDRVLRAVRAGRTLTDATAFLHLRAPPTPVQIPPGDPLPSRVQRLLALTRHIEQHPADFRPSMGGPVSFKVGRGLPEIRLTPGERTITRQGAREVTSRLYPEAPSVGLHTREYLADEHAITQRFKQTRHDLSRSLQMLENPLLRNPSGRTLSSHPRWEARYLNALYHIQRHPEVFQAGLKGPYLAMIHHDLPPVKLESGAGGIRMSGHEPVLARLPKAERMIFEPYQRAQDGYSSWIRKLGSSPVGRLLAPRLVESMPVARRTPPLGSPSAMLAVAARGTGRVPAPALVPGPGLLGTSLRGGAFGLGLVAGVDLAGQILTGRVPDLAQTAGVLTDGSTLRGLVGGLAGGMAGGALAQRFLQVGALAARSSAPGRFALGALSSAGAIVGAALAQGERPDWLRVLVPSLVTGALMVSLGPGLIPTLVTMAAGIAVDAGIVWLRTRASSPAAASGPRLLGQGAAS